MGHWTVIDYAFWEVYGGHSGFGRVFVRFSHQGVRISMSLFSLIYTCVKSLYATRNYHTFLMVVCEGGALVGGGGAVRPQAEMDLGSHVGKVL